MNKSSVHSSHFTCLLSVLFVLIVVLAALHVPAIAADSHEAEGGLITSISFTAASRTDHWQGYYGALSYIPPNSSQYPDYFNTSAGHSNSIRQVVLNITTFTPHEYLLITSSSSINVSGLQAGNVSQVDCITGTGPDSGTNTFTGSSTFDNIPDRGSIQNVPTAYISGNFSEGLLQDGASNNAFIVPIVAVGVCFDGTPCNFQFILPSNSSTPISYYMYYLSSQANISSQVTTPRVTGQIMHSNNKIGIPYVLVNLTNATTMNIVGSTHTNGTGYYNFTSPDAGDYYINASTLRFWDNSTAVSVTADETVIVNLSLWLKGDLNNNGKSADAGDLVLMNRAVLWEIQGGWQWDLNDNGIIADVGDLVLMNRAVLHEIILT